MPFKVLERPRPGVVCNTKLDFGLLILALLLGVENYKKGKTPMCTMKYLQTSEGTKNFSV